MSNVEIYDSSNSQLSSDEYSHEEEDYDALMDAAVSKQRPQKTKPKGPGSGKPGNGTADPPASADKDAKAESAPDPPSTRAETLQRIRQLQLQRRRWPNLYFKRRSMRWLRPNKMDYNTYLEGLKDLLPKRRNKLELLARYKTWRRRSYDSRSPSRSRSRSRSHSRSRSRSRSYSRSRSGSRSPELICLDDTENEESPEKPEIDTQARVTPTKEFKPRVAAPPPQLNFELPDKQKAHENGDFVLDEFLKKKEPQQPSYDLDNLPASLELEQTLNETLVQQEEQETAESLVMDATLKRRRSVTPPTSSEKCPNPENLDKEDDDTIEFLSVQQNKPDVAEPPLNLQTSVTPPANPLQNQPAFKLSTPYTLAHSSATKQADNLANVSYSLNTPTPPATPMEIEISYPNEKLPNNTKLNIQNYSTQHTSQVAVTAQRSPAQVPLREVSAQKAPAQTTPLRQAALQQMAAPSAPPQQMAPPKPAAPQHLAPPRSTPPQQMAPPRSVPPQQLAPPRGAPPLQWTPSRAEQPQQLAPPREAQPQQVAPPRGVPPQQLPPPREAAPQQLAPPPQQPQMHPHLPQVISPSFVVPQQPQPRRSETVSTQTQVSQSAQPTPSTTRQKPNIDLNNSDASFHYRIKELFEEIDTIMKDKVNSVRPELKAFTEERERIDADLETLDKLIAKKEEEYNRLLYLRHVKKELSARMERSERITMIKDLLPALLNKSVSTEELLEMHTLLVDEQQSPMPSKYGLSAVEQCLNHATLNQNNLRLLRGAMGLKEQAPPVSLRHFEEERQLFRRNSLPARQPPMRHVRDMGEEHQREFNQDNAPPSKRPKLFHPLDRYQEMANSTPNLAAASSSSYNKVQGPGKPPYYNNLSLDNHFDNESLMIKPLFNSSPMVSQREQSNRQYHESHSAYRNEDEMGDVKRKLGKSKSQDHKSIRKSKHEDAAATNGKEDKSCHECKRRKATYLCTGCQSQWYCSRECQLRAWDTHYRTCGI
ncbi:titin [Drosophila gunungcola]|uniref:MYND-type domain-containing protein n=1 Tax=Drosophila gunungcola TaxID=103775 RepID=A0A9P9YQB4_9MUSC|nr:titin [Drosophila gunungcola]XP_052844516.1 titin [Drosophila gunungcola]XP_052844517.1 titin [Drosophila gunungcola]XP_052844519.1 titin [Drosophila gunungcola]XP_052844520.1 titin [Drosophila gunungcola]XP_052844521.1 titin [Drosophila gunungcola]KAI8041131.1 hypothetical protein M5D96_005383 [Drosophila gunungcola]